MFFLYVLFALSVFFPVYTYVLYPLILCMLQGKEYKNGEITPSVSVIIVGDNSEKKVRDARKSNYIGELEVIEGSYISKTRGEICVFTDTKTELDLEAISSIVQPFADERVGCVVGKQTNPEGNSAFWKYENKVKLLESRIGCTSGAPASLFAVRESDMPDVPDNVLNKPFYIATKICEKGRAVVFQENAKAYEGKSEGTNFKKHVHDAAGYWQCFMLFPRMLRSFVYVSHRVMKWFVWLNMLMLLLTSGVLSVNGSILMTVFFWLQVVGYVTLLVLGKMKIGGMLGKALGIGYYFVMLNVAYFVGMFKVKSV